MAPVTVDSLLTNALIDTGSPCTIASLSLQRKSEVECTLLPEPGGMEGRCPSSHPVVMTLIFKYRNIETPVQLFLGTDFQAPLGFSLIIKLVQIKVNGLKNVTMSLLILINGMPMKLKLQ